ncbi:MAG: DUF456 domain-containing protein [Desulforhabdus sp.]|jgi:uncharacterized protein YqgC (DUF456 family)|nr:DUF456 domain-containing protein [Desulforhabdus sp.]
MWIESIGLGVIILFMLVGLVGAFIPLMPGPVLVWLAALVYALATKFTVVGPISFAVITIIALIAVSADLWMSVLGAKSLGASGRSILWGIGGALIGFVFLNLLGALIGYGLGILYHEYRRHNNWNAALKAGLGGLAGWGLSTAVQVGGSLLIIIIFVWQVLVN